MMMMISLLLAAAVLDVYADGPTLVRVGDVSGATPRSFQVEDGDVDTTISITPKDLPEFLVTVPAGTTKVDVSIAQPRPTATYEIDKRAYTSATTSLAVKFVGGLGSGVLSVAGFGTAGVLALLAEQVGVVPPLVSLGVAGLGCVGAVGLCGWSIVDGFGLPEEPMLARVHGVRCTRQDGSFTIIEVNAPSLDTDGDVQPPKEDLNDGAEGLDGQPPPNGVVTAGHARAQRY
jgi:hypothetical protein